MSRRRGEFEHRTSIFEGAFRAWSHLGGLEPEELESRPASDLDPLTNPIDSDPRLKNTKSKKGEEAPRNPDGSKRREYPYEPLPRSGLAHPYVQAILSPWLGPDADNEAIQLGLTTLRTWWQHRRKGESGSAIAALGTEKMKGVVEGYTRHFFTLAHCLIMNDKEQPPRSLHTKMKELDKIRNKRNKKRAREDEDSKLTAMALNGGFGGPGGMPGLGGGGGGPGGGGGGPGGMGPGGNPNEQAQLAAGINADLTDTTLSPLERLHAAQRRQLAESGGIHSTLPGVNGDVSALPPVVNMKGKCVPGKLDLPGIVDTVSHHAAQLSHRGASFPPPQVTSSGGGGGGMSAPSNQYGDPTTTPVVFVNAKGEIQIAMTVDGITCAHCVKIVETVLRGCNGNKSPIDGLLDAAADRVLCSVLIKIDRSSNAKRIAFEAARNLAMVGYTAKAKEMSVVDQGADKKVTMDLGALATAFEVVANNKNEDVFNWQLHCSCPDNGILRDDCPRHSQMNSRLFEAFEARAQQVKDYMAGCGKKYGMPCTCGSNCRCANCTDCKKPTEANGQNPMGQQNGMNDQMQQMQGGGGFGQDQFNGMMGGNGRGPPPQISTGNMDQFGDQFGGGNGGGGGMQGFGGDNGMNMNGMGNNGMGGGNGMGNNGQRGQLSPLGGGGADDLGMGGPVEMPMRGGGMGRRASRNPSVISFGGIGGIRGMSVTSEATFGRAMSGLSALSIDWENLEDFDVNVDHSAHINNNNGGGNMKKEVENNVDV